MSHSEGPWKVHGGWGGMVKSVNGKNVAECSIPGLSAEEIEANMKLIAASPKLLEALRQCVEKLDDVYGECEAVVNALDVIKKATG
jgi:hypothetical protein